MINIYEEEGITCVESKLVRPNIKGITIYVFLVDGMLIETGPENLRSELIPFFKESPFDFVTLTHSHEDHSGNAPWIQKELNKNIYVHEKGISTCEQSIPYGEYRQISWGKRESFRPEPLSNMIKSNHLEWEVIYTPGHANDHVALFNKENGRMFTGDLFITTKTRTIMRNESIPQMMNSIRKLLTYDFDSMFCSHSGYLQEGKKILKSKLNHLEDTYGEVKYLEKKGYTANEIRDELFPNRYSVIELSKGEIDSLHIITSILEDT